LTVTVVLAVAVHPLAFSTVTVYGPLADTLMLAVVAPVFHE
jgi:hypothetical protein